MGDSTMSNDLFQTRLTNWKNEGDLCAFNLACVAEALDTVKSLNDQNIGWEVVEQRLGEYKNWDPDIIKADKDAENGYWRRLEEQGTPFLFLSEEAGTVNVNEGAEGDRRFVVCDPFDGSWLFKHGIPAFWYSSLAFYAEDRSPLCCAVGDCYPRVIAFANAEGAFVSELEGDNLVHRARLNKAYRKSMGRPDMTQMAGASI